MLQRLLTLWRRHKSRAKIVQFGDGKYALFVRYRGFIDLDNPKQAWNVPEYVDEHCKGTEKDALAAWAKLYECEDNRKQTVVRYLP